ncbi:ACP S-malonyltransferase [Variovorax sp. NFACC27]|uniref:ACP S-malonyltransferase n=1 Tax=unclassified Variovorax TaxID=663243 RepID=UPI0008957C74|nr:ACP S-malonyltransferase [Variovorax sp. YR750]SEF29789.1 malonyl CoA-acyl carrier protein transacylase [Variovorax sp. NFACC28]SEG86060.1 malonyl CoA-acyl carrier protein transacylase [Variovorax sp. NFACC29]SFD22901.1 malonyl CoA-acyl carrier protein transacylase [Variovorax sp. NFACC26]SFG29707.1 malonyl CoA-acyl carrier protein transacylase [Variovorax sp. NFACC27]SEM52431.1 malonyl CoA-acyl carrier protein transacylase [Variovorax sp. YR750]
MHAFVFPGQGSQKKGMGAGLFDEVKEYVSIEREVDALLGYSMRDFCANASQSQLMETRYTQPSLFVVNALHYYAARSRGQHAGIVAGHSLGEYNALLAAGAFDLLTGLRLVQKRGELMGQVKSGGMAAVLGPGAARVESILRGADLAGIDVANYNAPNQTVISGKKDDLTLACRLLEKEADACVPLPVSAAFHSRYMIDAARAFQDFLVDFSFEPLLLPVISNVTGRPYPAGDPTLTVRAFLVRQISRPVLWTQSVRHMSESGVDEFHEIGPGTVLTRLIQQIREYDATMA